MATEHERDYVLGTHDDEIDRLGVQHNVWRPWSSAAWQRAGFTIGQTILDVGCGPGYATVDLAQLVGSSGCVFGFDRSRRFLGAAEARCRALGLDNVAFVEADLDELSFARESADGAWDRWVLAFVKRPRKLLERIASALKPGGAFVCHEYVDYEGWRTLPPSRTFEEFTKVVTNNWRASGGEPDVGADIPGWLEELGFDVEVAEPRVFAISARDYMWQWPASFMDVGLKHLIDTGVIDPERGRVWTSDLQAIIKSPSTRMITPAVLEIIARKH